MATGSAGSEIKWETLIQCISHKDLYQTVKYVIIYTPDSSGMWAIHYLNSIIQYNGKSPYKEEVLKWINKPELTPTETLGTFLSTFKELQWQYNLYRARKDKIAEAIQTSPGNKEEDKAIQPSVESKSEKSSEKKTNKTVSYDVTPESENTDENKTNSLPPSTKPPEVPLQNTGDVNKPPIQSEHVGRSLANDPSKTPVLSVQTTSKIDERKPGCSGSVASAKPAQENTGGSDSAEKKPVKPPNNGIPNITKPNFPAVNKLQEAQTEKNLAKSTKVEPIIHFPLAGTHQNLKIAQAEKTVPNNVAEPPKRKADKAKKEYNILLFGETGVGKSTFINGFHNYITYKTFKKALEKGPKVTVPFQLEINGQLHNFGDNTQGNENLNQSGQSVTQNSKCYTVEEGDVCYNFIDTPGLSDTRGIAYDRENSDKTMTFLKDFEKEIHAICILFKADKSKLTPEFTNALGNLFKIHKNVANNIFFWFTHCQNGYGASLNTLCSQRINPNDLSAKGKFPEIIQTFWKDNIKEVEKFKGILLKKQAISLKETIELFQLEKDYQTAAGDTVAAISECADMIDNGVKNFIIAEKYLAQSFIMYNRSCLYDQMATYARAKDKQSVAFQFYKIMYDMFCNEKKLKNSNNIKIEEIEAAIDYLKNKENIHCSRV